MSRVRSPSSQGCVGGEVDRAVEPESRLAGAAVAVGDDEPVGGERGRAGRVDDDRFGLRDRVGDEFLDRDEPDGGRVAGESDVAGAEVEQP